MRFLEESAAKMKSKSKNLKAGNFNIKIKTCQVLHLHIFMHYKQGILSFSGFYQWASKPSTSTGIQELIIKELNYEFGEKSKSKACIRQIRRGGVLSTC